MLVTCWTKAAKQRYYNESRNRIDQECSSGRVVVERRGDEGRLVAIVLHDTIGACQKSAPPNPETALPKDLSDGITTFVKNGKDGAVEA